eukprot:CAMPEP_0172016674 /NCGR_PEP_ID=MMETSP1041-20130122/11148_1 /TAXON_ID=464988 /ORGANISM="Hemiselmis andersenii, Strain CCMP439" /LENGTH=374 /DNA_ID=CAMNT_0012671635 /DNA_START=1 /DNA_END=1121 /DNA_ORIENTATION=+
MEAVSEGDLKAVLSHMDSGYASMFGLCGEVEDDGEMITWHRKATEVNDDSVAKAQSLSLSADTVQLKLSSSQQALSDAHDHLTPVLSIPQLTRHPQLKMALGHVRTAIVLLEGEVEHLKEKAEACRAAASMPHWLSLPSVVSWSGPSVSFSREARHKLRERLGRAVTVMAAAEALGAHGVAAKIARRVADVLAVCDSSSDASQLLGIAPQAAESSTSPSECFDTAFAAARGVCGVGLPPPQEAVAIARLVCTVGLGGKCAVRIAQEVMDRGWRVVAGDVGGEAVVTYMMHEHSMGVIEIQNKPRASLFFRFRSSSSSPPFKADSRGNTEPSPFDKPSHVSAFDAQHPLVTPVSSSEPSSHSAFPAAAYAPTPAA